jgi:hypothetical protein
MRLPFFFPAAGSVMQLGKYTAAALLAGLLAACASDAPGAKIVGHSAPVEPEAKIVDYRLVDCARIWDVEESKTSNPLYWLRATDCAARLSAADARAQARQQGGDSWQGAFKEAVLMANGNVTPVERRQYMLQLDAFSRDYPAAVRPLLQLWRDNQMAQLQLSEERTRYHHLQQTSDAQLDALRQQQATLNSELKVTRRKLDTLTDIERQLSTRRSPDGSDGHSEKNDAEKGAQR